MNTPNETLMDAYGTRHLLEEKKAEMSPWIPRVAAGLGAYLLYKGMQGNREEARMEEGAQTELSRRLALQQMMEATRNARYTPAPMVIPAGMSIPVGWDRGMVRMAPYEDPGVGADYPGAVPPPLEVTASAIGEKMAKVATAKNAGIGGAMMKTVTSAMPKSFKGQLALGGLAAGGLYAGSKAINGAANFMQKEPEGPSVYGAGRFGTQLPHAVNQYGQPQVGTPL